MLPGTPAQATEASLAERAEEGLAESFLLLRPGAKTNLQLHKANVHRDELTCPNIPGKLLSTDVIELWVAVLEGHQLQGLGLQARSRNRAGRLALMLCGQSQGNLSFLLLTPLLGAVEPPISPLSPAPLKPRLSHSSWGSQDFKPFAMRTAVSAFKCSSRALAVQQIREQLNTLLPNLNPLFLLQHNPLFCLRNVHFRKQLLKLSGLPISHTRSSAFAQCRHSQLKCCH